jgi:hypothetical protein
MPNRIDKIFVDSGRLLMPVSEADLRRPSSPDRRSGRTRMKPKCKRVTISWKMQDHGRCRIMADAGKNIFGCYPDARGSSAPTSGDGGVGVEIGAVLFG